MKNPVLHLLCLCALLSLGQFHATAGDIAAAARSVALADVAEYNASVDHLFRAALAAGGKFTPDANEIIALRTSEYQILAHARFGILKRADLPAFAFAEGKPRQLAEVPGRVLELRLLKLGVNPWDDGLTAKLFHLSGSNATFSAPALTNAFPELGDFKASYAYGMNLIERREWAEAIPALNDASVATAGGAWEFQVQVTVAWAQVMRADFVGARATLAAALARDHRCEVPVRARFLCALLGLGNQSLSPEVLAALPVLN